MEITTLTENTGSTMAFVLASTTIFAFTFFVLWLFLRSDKINKLKAGEKGILIMVLFGFAFALVYGILALLAKVYI